MTAHDDLRRRLENSSYSELIEIISIERKHYTEEAITLAEDIIKKRKFDEIKTHVGAARKAHTEGRTEDVEKTRVQINSILRRGRAIKTEESINVKNDEVIIYGGSDIVQRIAAIISFIGCLIGSFFIIINGIFNRRLDGDEFFLAFLILIPIVSTIYLIISMKLLKASEVQKIENQNKLMKMKIEHKRLQEELKG